MAHTLRVTQKQNRWGDRLRIVFALAVKDIGDSFKNKTILALVISILFTVVFFRVLPHFSQGDEMNVLVYYASPAPTVLNAIMDSDQLELWEGYESAAQMKNRLSGGDVTEVGLVLPADLEEQLARGDRPEISAYVAYWVSAAQAEEARQRVEEEIAFWTGREVTVTLERERVYLDMATDGLDVTFALSMIYVLTLIGASLVPHLMLEEKQAKTMDALLVSPATPGLIMAGKALTGLFFALIGAAILLVMYAAAFLHWPLAIIAVLLGALFVVGMGLVIGMLIENKHMLQLVAWIVLIPLLLGFFLNLMGELLPDFAGRILHWIPTVVLARLLKVAMVVEIPWSTWAVDLVYMGGLSLVLLGVVVWLVRRMDR